MQRTTNAARACIIPVVQGGRRSLNGRALLVMSDYYCSYIEVSRTTSTTSRSITKAMKEVFARCGIPNVVVSDNDPQITSAEFSAFATTWHFDHKTSSSHHHQSNGKAENAVKTVKRLFSKCKESGQSEFLVFLDWRNTPTEGSGQALHSASWEEGAKTLLPTAGTLLQPRHDIEQETRALVGMKQRQRHYYDKHAKPLKPIATGETVRMKLSGQKKWKAGTCTERVDDRSYMVKVGDVEYRRNRWQLIASQEDDLPLVPEAIELTRPQVDDNSTNCNAPPGAHPQEDAGVTSPSTESPCRSGRVRKAPEWHKDHAIKQLRNSCI